MKILFEILFYSSGFIIFWAMIGYPLSLKLIERIYRDRKLKKDYSYQPTVTVMAVAHNEEKVILDKLQNMMELDYPKDKIEFLIASDYSTDRTNDIVKEFIASHQERKITLFEVKVRKGKTNAQNEAYKKVSTDYIVMTDTNSIMDRNSIKELMASFTSEDIAYVSGRLVLVNGESSEVSHVEGRYWENDVKVREIEGEVQTITAGNGALYACRTKDYYEFNPIECHDSAMPVLYAIQGKRAIANHDAVAYEKAGEVIEDEFSRKIRMNRLLLKHILPDIRIFNIFKFKWFSYFYFGHRTCRYLLWISHFIVFIANAFLIHVSKFYLLVFLGQVLFYSLAFVKFVTKINNRYINVIYYYCMTILAQYIGVFNELSGRSKPFWEKAESTR